MRKTKIIATLGPASFNKETISGLIDNGMDVARVNMSHYNEKIGLDNAYPNPFNPVTTLNYSLPESQDIMLQVYDLQGRVVETLIDGNIAAGYHTATWNADHHASGVYFVKMIAGEYVNTQKLMLIK